jgi:hypothetical protein
MSSGRFAQGPSPGFRVGARLPVVRSGEPPEGHDAKVDLGGSGTDPRGNWGGRFEDNGANVSHDEPSVKVISSAPGRGSTRTDVMRPAKDPKGKPAVSPNGKMVSDYAELSPAPWFGLTTRVPAGPRPVIIDGSEYTHVPRFLAGRAETKRWC